MKKLLLGLCLVSSMSFGIIGGVISDILDTSSTNLPTTYTDSDAERLSDLKYKTHVAVTNDTASAIYVCWKAKNAASCVDDWYLPANSSFVFDEVATSAQVFLRSATGSPISSGIIATAAW